jgi:hypothetical protein
MTTSTKTLQFLVHCENETDQMQFSHHSDFLGTMLQQDLGARRAGQWELPRRAHRPFLHTSTTVLDHAAMLISLCIKG